MLCGKLKPPHNDIFRLLIFMQVLALVVELLFEKVVIGVKPVDHSGCSQVYLVLLLILLAVNGFKSLQTSGFLSTILGVWRSLVATLLSIPLIVTQFWLSLMTWVLEVASVPALKPVVVVHVNIDIVYMVDVVLGHSSLLKSHWYWSQTWLYQVSFIFSEITYH